MHHCKDIFTAHEHTNDAGAVRGDGQVDGMKYLVILIGTREAA